MGGTGGEDCWIRADIFIKQRQSGEINGESSEEFFEARKFIYNK
jgi:hypothetical protein